MAQSTRIVTCARCNGAGNYYQQGKVVRCEECGGAGQLLEEFESHAGEYQGCGKSVAMLAVLVVAVIAMVQWVA